MSHGAHGTPGSGSPEPTRSHSGGVVAVRAVVALGLATLVITLRYPQSDPNQLPPVMTAAWGVCWLLPGAVVAWHRPRELMGYLMLGFGALLSVTALSQVFQLHVHVGTAITLQQELFRRLSVSLYITLGLGVGLLAHLFPTGRPPASPWRWVVRILVGCSAVIVLGLALGIDGAHSPHPVVKLAAGVVGVGYALSLLAAIPSLGYRAWRATGVEREQVKWFLLAVVLATIGWFVNQIPLPIRVVFIVGLPPLAIALALLRYRLYDIDRVISRTASYAIVTGALLVIYALVVTSVTRLLPDSSTLAVAAATLAAAALARPLLRRVQGSVDRRFNRARYDAQRTVEVFGARLRHEIDSATVERDLRGVVLQTLEPTSVSVWLRSSA